jgi:hypothetical protein
MTELIAILLFIALIGAINTVAEVCGDHIEDWWKGKLK